MTADLIDVLLEQARDTPERAQALLNEALGGQAGWWLGTAVVAGSCSYRTSRTPGSWSIRRRVVAEPAGQSPRVEGPEGVGADAEVSLRLGIEEGQRAGDPHRAGGVHPRRPPGDPGGATR